MLFNWMILVLSFATILILIGFFAKNKFEIGRSQYFSIAGGVLLLVLAFFLWTEGVDIKQGYTAVESISAGGNITTTDANFTYMPIDSSLDTVFFWVLLTAGLISIAASAISLYNQKYEVKDESLYMDLSGYDEGERYR